MPGIRILLVADDPAMAAGLQATLRAAGHETVALARSGKEAVTLSFSVKPDLAFVSAGLKGRPTGAETGSSLRHACRIPILYLGADTHPIPFDPQLSPALFGYLLPPFDPRTLAIAIDLALLRHRIEQSLEENRRWLATALDSIGDGVLTADRDGLVTYMNPSAEAITLWKRKEAIGRHLQDVCALRRVDSDDLLDIAGDRKSWSAAADSGQAVAILDKQGRKKEIVASVSPILSPNGEREGVILVVHDVTRRRIHERHHQSMEKMEALGKLSSTVAHEFSTLFGILTGLASSLLSSLASNTRAYEDAQKLLDAARHGQDLNRRILVIARASNAEGDIRLQPVSLRQAVKRAIELAQPALQQRRVEIRFQETDPLPFVLADPGQLVDVLMDFFYNAGEAMPAGGAVRISVHEQKVKRPDLKANPKAQSGPYAVIRIADPGTGMTPEVVERIFEPFFSTKKTRGVGLGLAVANSAILGYGGWIRVKSAPDKGTTFHLFIPVAPDAPAARKEQAPLLLLIDHEEDLLNESAAILKSGGYRVQTAGSAAEGIAAYRQTPGAFALCIVDAIMPDMDTGEMIRTLFEVKPDTPLLITSGFSRDYMRRFMPRGEWGFVQKPVERESLLGGVSRLLGRPLEAPPS